MNKLLLTIATFLFGVGAAFGQAFPNYPTVGVPANTECLSYGNNGVCNQYRPAGPNALAPTATFPADTNSSNGSMQQTVRVPVSRFAQGMGTAQVVTTNASVALADGVSTLISNQAAATIALVNFPPNPTDNLVVRITNSGSGVLTLTSVAVAVGSGQSIVGTAPATLGILTNNAAAAVETSAAWLYQLSNKTWYRVQ